MSAVEPVHDTGDEWRERAACRGVDPDIFFIERGASSGPARAFCDICGVRAECLTFALDSNEHHGVWGGLSEWQRRKLRSRSRIRAVGGRPPRDEDTTRKAAWLWRQHWRPAEIIRELGLPTKRDLYRRLGDAGIEVTPPHDWRRTPRSSR